MVPHVGNESDLVSYVRPTASDPGGPPTGHNALGLRFDGSSCPVDYWRTLDHTVSCGLVTSSGKPASISVSRARGQPYETMGSTESSMVYSGSGTVLERIEGWSVSLRVEDSAGGNLTSG